MTSRLLYTVAIKYKWALSRYTAALENKWAIDIDRVREMLYLEV